MIEKIESIKYEWKQQIDQPFNATILANIKDRYDRAVAMKKVWDDLYNRYRGEWSRELQESRNKARESFRGMSKRDVAAKTGFGKCSDSELRRITVSYMIDTYIVLVIDDSVNTDHNRVKSHWDRLSDDQKLGLEPID